MAVNLITDTFGTNSNPPSKTFKMVKTLSATPTTSGAAVTDTENFFNKDCPFPIEVISVVAVVQSLTTADFNGTGGAVSIIVQRSDEVDASPAAPTTPGWDTLLASASIKDKATDALAVAAPGDGTHVLDQTYVAVPKGGSLRATLSAQVEDTYASTGSLVTVLVIVECRPTGLKEKLYF